MALQALITLNEGKASGERKTNKAREQRQTQNEGRDYNAN